VLQPGAEPDLAEEPVGAQHLSQVGMEDFEGYRPIMLEVVRQENRGHTAAPQLAVDPVAVGQRRLKAIQQIGQAGSGGRLCPDVTPALGGGPGGARWKSPALSHDGHASRVLFSRGQVEVGVQVADRIVYPPPPPNSPASAAGDPARARANLHSLDRSRRPPPARRPALRQAPRLQAWVRHQSARILVQIVGASAQKCRQLGARPDRQRTTCLRR